GAAIDEEWLPAAAEADAAGHPEAAEHAAAPPPAVAALDVVQPLEGGETQLVVELGTQLADIERRVILATYERCGRHKERTAALLGISMKTLYNRLKEYQL